MQDIDNVWTSPWSCSDKLAQFPETVGGASDSVMMSLRRFFGAFCAIFRTPFTWTSSPGFQGDDFFGSPRRRRFLRCRGLGGGGDAGSLTPRCSATHSLFNRCVAPSISVRNNQNNQNNHNNHSNPPTMASPLVGGGGAQDEGVFSFV